MGSRSVGAAERKAAVFGTATANLRSGAGVEHALKTILKEGDQVSVEKLAGEWHLVAAADGQKGFVHRNLLKLAADSAPQPTPPKAISVESKEPAKEAAPAPPVAAPTAAPPPAPVIEQPKTPAAPSVPSGPAQRVEPAKAPEAKSQSILQMLEGYETELKIGLIIAAIAFVLGWVCGGNYYARRERKSRYKLRF